MLDKELLKKMIDEKFVSARKHPTEELWIYNYTPSAAYGRVWNEVTLICRGLVLDAEYNIIARPFRKFFNVEELEPEIIPRLPFDVYEKMDGCCHEDTQLITDSGILTIKEICDTKFRGKVLSYDIDSGIEFYDDIIDSLIQKNNNDWYEIELENGILLKLTGNHRIWINNLKCWRKVEDLDGTEDLQITNFIINNL